MLNFAAELELNLALIQWNSLVLFSLADLFITRQEFGNRVIVNGGIRVDNSFPSRDIWDFLHPIGHLLH